MTENNQDKLNAIQTAAVHQTLSSERMRKYIIAAGHDPERALDLYLWNAKLGAAFHTPIQAVEVALRNCVNLALCAQFNDRWWENDSFLALIDHEREQDLRLVLRRIKNRKQQDTNGQVVAGLSFGFWVGMLQGRYNPSLWSKQIKIAFAKLPNDRGRKSLVKRAGEIAHLRNRISHHEPLIERDHHDDYRRVIEMLRWICPDKADWTAANCTVPHVIRERP